MPKIIPLDQLIKRARQLPWPVNGRVANEGAMSPDQLEATRILRRHSANQLPNLIDVGESIIAAGRPHGGMGNPQFPDGCECDKCEAWDKLKITLDKAEKVMVED